MQAYVILSTKLFFLGKICRPHYNVNMTSVQVGHIKLNISKEVFEAGDRKGTIIDSGTTLAYLPEMVYEPLVSKVCDIYEPFLRYMI
jgi:hypothetical protein